MRNRVVWLMAALGIALLASGPGQAQITNLLQNPGFETGALAPWGSYGSSVATVTSTVVKDCTGANVPEGPVEGTYCLDVKVSGAGTNFWDGAVSPVLISGQGVFKQGKKYTLSLFMKSKGGTATINLKPELAQDPWTGYGETQITATEKWQEFHTTTPVMTADVTPAHLTFHVLFKAQEFWIDDVKWYEGDYVPTVVKSNRAATSPVPDDKATDVARDVTLGWKAGPYAATHNVYLGTSFTDVNTADLSKAVSAGQSGTSYQMTTPLQYGQTYYWRVDEVNAAPSNTVVKGAVWSFTVEPYSYQLTNITATASSTQAGSSAQNTANGSGLTNGLHGVDGATMWQSTGSPLPNWIQYQFDNTYKLDKMQVWNSNQMIESVLGFGAKDVTVEYSTDGTTWTAVANVPQFAQAPGMAGYAANTTVDMGGAMAKYVRLTINSTWGPTNFAGLSEVQFTYVPVVARLPQPANNATGVSLSAGLDWRPGRDATSQSVYLGTDKAAVTNETVAAQTVANHGLTPAALTFGTNYYWKVDEVGAAMTYPGPVWKFTTQEWAVVDDFESYNDTTHTIYDTWYDGLGGNGTGSTVGYTPTAAEMTAGAHFVETSIVNSGRQSMPFDYNNVAAPYTSEAIRTFDPPQDWTVGGADTLQLSYRGYPALTTFTVNANAAGTALSVTGAGTDIWGSSDDFSYAYKTLTGDGSIVARVTDKGTGTNTWAKGGVMIRANLLGGSQHAMMVLTANSDGTAGNGCSFQWRTTANAGPGSNVDGTAPAINVPYYVKVQRAGDALSGWVSADGKTWKQLGTNQIIAMNNPVYVGLCVTSHAAGQPRTFQFDNIATTGNVSGSWQGAAINSPRYNGVTPMYVTVEDKAGKKKTVVNPDASAVAAGAWTAWKIKLSDLTGVNLAAVKKLTLGVGDTASSKAGATGRIFFDDIVFGKPLTPIGLVANYPFENDVKDVSGNGHDGTLVGTPTYVTGAPGHGTGMLFPGTTNNMVSLGTFNPSEQTGMLSVSLWAKWNGLTSYYQGLIGKRNTWAAGQTMWQIEANQTSGALSFSRYSATGTASAPVLTVGAWTHIALTFDRTTAQFYINGAKAGTPTSAFTFGPNLDAAVEIGNNDGGGGNPFNGALDEVRLYDYALTPAEILALAK